jgi:hypothetical protein
MARSLAFGFIRMTNQTVNEKEVAIDGKHFVTEMRKCGSKNAARKLGKKMVGQERFV